MGIELRAISKSFGSQELFRDLSLRVEDVITSYSIHYTKLYDKSFGSQELFRDLSLRVEEGTFHVLVGPSGEGKSTLLSIIAGLQKPDSGEIYLNDICVTKRQPQQRDVGFVFQDYALFPHLTALQNVEYGLKASGVEKQTACVITSYSIHYTKLYD